MRFQNLESLYGYILRKVFAIWQVLDIEGQRGYEVQAGAATVFLNVVKTLPIAFLASEQEGNPALREQVDRYLDCYRSALESATRIWSRLSAKYPEAKFGADQIQATAATLMIEYLKVNGPIIPNPETDPEDQSVLVSHG